jgi:hypothetical protein
MTSVPPGRTCAGGRGFYRLPAHRAARSGSSRQGQELYLVAAGVGPSGVRGRCFRSGRGRSRAAQPRGSRGPPSARRASARRAARPRRRAAPPRRRLARARRRAAPAARFSALAQRRSARARLGSAPAPRRPALERRGFALEPRRYALERPGFALAPRRHALARRGFAPAPRRYALARRGFAPAARRLAPAPRRRKGVCAGCAGRGSDIPRRRSSEAARYPTNRPRSGIGRARADPVGRTAVSARAAAGGPSPSAPTRSTTASPPSAPTPPETRAVWTVRFGSRGGTFTVEQMRGGESPKLAA